MNTSIQLLFSKMLCRFESTLRCTWRATQKDLTLGRIFTRSWVIGSVFKLWSWFSDMFETHRSLFIRKNPDAKIPILTYFLVANVKWNRDFHDFSEKKTFGISKSSFSMLRWSWACRFLQQIHRGCFYCFLTFTVCYQVTVYYHKPTDTRLIVILHLK